MADLDSERTRTTPVRTAAKTALTVGHGIWQCSYCDYKFTGGSYKPETPGGKTVRRSIRAARSEESA